MDIARERGYYDLWVGVEGNDEAALATYRSAGAGDDGGFRMLTWEFGDGARTAPST